MPVNRDNYNMTDDLLVKYLLGEALQEDKAAVEQWVQSSAANRKYFEDFKTIWDTSKQLAAKTDIDAEAAWQRFRMRTEHMDNDSGAHIIPLRRFQFARAAAILILLLGGGLLLYFLGFSNNMHTTVAGNNVLIDTLPDGSVITLNKNAVLKYPETFSGNTRSVELQGEAFFNVSPDKQKPFIIHANESVITVVGTSFNVNSSKEKTEVIVETGIVEVAKKSHSVKLNPNEKATVTRNEARPVKQDNTDALYNYYRTQEFICNGTPLWRLVDVLNQAYNVDIVIADNKLKDLPLTTTFRNEPLDNILLVIRETFNITIEKKNGQIILK